ncbi:hypothetical protein P5673_032808, partial [Acropora cervicornis]
CNHWKYVDNITLSDTLLRGQPSCLQSDSDRIHQWAVDNNMCLNPSKSLQTLNLPSLLLGRESLCSKSFSNLTSLANPRFIPLLPPRRSDANDSAASLHNSSNFTLPAVRTERFKRSFIPSMLFSQ